MSWELHEDDCDTWGLADSSDSDHDLMLVIFDGSLFVSIKDIDHWDGNPEYPFPVQAEYIIPLDKVDELIALLRSLKNRIEDEP